MIIGGFTTPPEVCFLFVGISSTDFFLIGISQDHKATLYLQLAID